MLGALAASLIHITVAVAAVVAVPVAIVDDSGGVLARWASTPSIGTDDTCSMQPHIIRSNTGIIRRVLRVEQPKKVQKISIWKGSR